MRYSYCLFLCTSALIFVEGYLIRSVNAEIVPDHSFGGDAATIDNSIIFGGITQGNALFHSFELFNVAANENISFFNPDGIDNILSRVVGDQPSMINGTLGVGGEANLFFLNPNGIFFGPNAELDINGAFTASTADRIILDNTDDFRAIAPNIPPLVAVNIEIGPQFAATPLADIVSEGDITTWQDLTLSGRSIRLSNSSLRSGGNILLDGIDIQINNDSEVITGISETAGSPDTSETVLISGDIDILGSRITIDDSVVSTGIQESSYSFGDGGYYSGYYGSGYYYSSSINIDNITTGRITLEGDAIDISEADINTKIEAITGSGTTGTIDVRANRDVVVRDNSNINTSFLVSPRDSTSIVAESGNITLDASGSVTITGDSMVEIEIAEVEVPEAELLAVSESATVTTFATSEILASDTPDISAILEFRGGGILVEANNTVNLSNNSQIRNSASTLTNNPENVVSSGGVEIAANRLTVESGGEISVLNRQGAAGTATLGANDIVLDQGTIRTETGASGTGDIRFNPVDRAPIPRDSDLLDDSIAIDRASSRLTMTNESLISSTGFDGATAGDISLENLGQVSGLAPTGEDGSDIISRGDAATKGERGAITVGNNISGFTFQTAVPGNRTNDIETDPPPEPPPPPEPDLPEFIEPRSDTNVFTPASTTFPESLERVRGYCETADAEDTINRGVAVSGRGGLPTAPTDALEAPIEDSGWIYPTVSPMQSTTLAWSDGERTAAGCRQIWTAETG